MAFDMVSGQLVSALCQPVLEVVRPLLVGRRPLGRTQRPLGATEAQKVVIESAAVIPVEEPRDVRPPVRFLHIDEAVMLRTSTRDQLTCRGCAMRPTVRIGGLRLTAGLVL
jgi:hypothetical protein